MTSAPLAKIEEFEETEDLEELEPPERTKEERRAWYQEALDSLEHYERTGLHLTGEEVDAWLDTWSDEKFIEPPECHT